MIIMQLLGGLGNQMFQYALGRRLSLEQNVPLKFDDRTHIANTPRQLNLGCFQLDIAFAASEEIKPYVDPRPHYKLWRWLQRRVIPISMRSFVRERTFYRYDPQILASRAQQKYLVGYWQNEAYFKPIEKLIRQEFQWRTALDVESQTLAREIESSASVSLHIRRGDYVSDANANNFHGLLPLDYYLRAADALGSQIGDFHLFVFSDDPAWARQQLKLPYAVTIVEHTQQIPDDTDMRLISLCRHHIIANSSFSWWGAWLAYFPQKIVYAPQQWVKNPYIDTSQVTPTGWHRI